MGLATARAFATSGARVTLADINADALRSATDALTAAGHQVLGVVCDVSDEDTVAAMVERTVAAFGRLDMAFNNAGIMIPPSDIDARPNRERLAAGGWHLQPGRGDPGQHQRDRLYPNERSEQRTGKRSRGRSGGRRAICLPGA